MINKKTRIIFFGSSSYVIPIIEIININFDLVLIVTTEKNPSDPITSYCKNKNIECISAVSIKDSEIKNKIKSLNPDIGLVTDFGLIITPEIIDIFPKGIINIHPSLLPKYRGPTPVQNSILDGNNETGVSIIKIDKKIDHGPLLFQTKETIKNTDTSESLYQRLFKIGAEALSEAVKSYLNGKTLNEQDHKKATFTKILTRQSGYIDINNPPKKDIIDKMIKAYYPWPGVWTEINLNNKNLRIKLLPDKRLQAEGKKPIGYKDFLNGYPEAKEKLKKIIS